jgi:hypothetical protein
MRRSLHIICFLSLTAGAARAVELHADIRPSFEKDDVEVIVKATSAVAMTRACKGLVRLVPKYGQSVTSVLNSNDTTFGPGTSDKEIAKKIEEHQQENDCATLTQALNEGYYKNVFLEVAR